MKIAVYQNNVMWAWETNEKKKSIIKIFASYCHTKNVMMKKVLSNRKKNCDFIGNKKKL